VRLDIADIVISVTSPDLDIAFLKDKSYYRDFLTKKEPEIAFRIHHSHPPECDFKKKVFDTNSLWKLYREDGKYILWLGPSESPFPDRLVFFDPAFKSGEIYILPDPSNTNLLFNPIQYPLDQILMVNLLSKGRGIMIHACGVIDHGNGIIFAGKSGAGKSTIANLWQGSERGSVLSDDRIIIRKREGLFHIYGTPWHGHSKVCSPQKAPLEKIYFIKHSKENTIRELSATEATYRLIVRSFPTLWDKEGMDFSLKFCSELAQNIPSYELGFVPDEGVLDLVKGGRGRIKRIDSLNLSREILNRGGDVRIPVVGSSMWPLIKTGDIIFIEPVDIEQISIGDIIVCRRGRRMVAHRLMKKYIDNGRTVLVTKGDTFCGFDSPFFSEDVLGKVRAIERRTRRIMINEGLYGVINIFCAKISYFSKWIYPPLRKVKHRIDNIKNRHANRRPAGELSCKTEY